MGLEEKRPCPGGVCRSAGTVRRPRLGAPSSKRSLRLPGFPQETRVTTRRGFFRHLNIGPGREKEKEED